MNTEQIKAVTAATDGYVLLPAGDGLPECLTNTDDLQEVRARVLALHPALVNTADGIARTGILLTETIRELDAKVEAGKGLTAAELKEICTDVRLATVLLGALLGSPIVGQGSHVYRGFADMIVDMEAASKLLTMPLADQAS
ncbi:hypothetical protein [Alishewanella longhuensis]